MNDILDETPLDLLDCAVAATQSMEGEGYNDVAEALAVQFAERGDIERAIDLADSIPDPYVRDRSLGSIAATGIKAGSDQTDELLDGIEDPMMRDVALEQVAMQYALVGNYEKALDASSEIANRDVVLNNIAIVLGQKDSMNDALDQIESIETDRVRTLTLGRLATIAIEKGNLSEATEVLDSLIQRESEMEFPEDRLDALVTIASVSDMLGENDLAVQKYLEAYELREELRQSGLESSAVIAQIVGGLAQVKQFKKADDILSNVEDPLEFCDASILLAMAYHKNGQEREATELLTQAYELGNDEVGSRAGDVLVRDGLFAELAMSSASCGNYPLAEKAISAITGAETRFTINKQVGQLAALASRQDVVFHLADLFSEPAEKSSYWLAICESTASEPENLEKAISQALSFADQIERPYSRSIALADIAFRIAKDSPERADAVFIRSVKTIAEIEGNQSIAEVLLNLAQKNWKLGRQTTIEEQQHLHALLNKLESADT